MFLRNVRRPQSAQVSNECDSHAATFIQMGDSNGYIRPWTAHPKVRSEVSPRRIPRQHLCKSHMHVPGRNTEAHIDTVSTLNFQSYENLHENPRVTTGPQISQEEGISQGTRHLSFENWVDGSPHDSEEYDTDVEEEKKPVSKKSNLLSDPTGIFTYEEQCQKHGCVPISYLRRHLNKRNIHMRHHYLGGLATKPVAAALKRNTVTEHVDLADNCVEGAGAYYLADMLKENMFIVYLNLANNFIQSTGAAAFAGMLEVNTTLKTLSLAGVHDGFLLGDSGYPCRRYLMTPNHNTGNIRHRDRYNYSLCRTRVLIEQTFAILKRRFPCLSLGLRTNPTRACKYVVSCAILHNIGILKQHIINHVDELTVQGPDQQQHCPELLQLEKKNNLNQCTRWAK